MARYVITGGSGFVGRSLARRIQANGDEAILATRTRHHPDDRHSWVEYDLQRRSTVTNILEARPDGIFHLAWSTTPGSAEIDPASDAQINLGGTLELFQALSNDRSIPLVLASSGGTVYGKAGVLPIPEDHPLKPIGIYGITKAAAEQYAASFREIKNMDIRVARLSNPFGASQSVAKLQGAASIFARKVVLGEPITIWGDGSVVRDFIDVDDVAGALMKIMTIEKRALTAAPVFNLGSGEGVSINQLLEIIGDAAERQPNVTYTRSRDFDIPSNVLDISRITRLTGWRPARSTVAAIQSMVQTVRESLR